MTLTKGQEKCLWELIEWEATHEDHEWYSKAGKNPPKAFKELEKLGFVVGATVVNHYWGSSGSSKEMMKVKRPDGTTEYKFYPKAVPKGWLKGKGGTYWTVKLTEDGMAYAANITSPISSGE